MTGTLLPHPTTPPRPNGQETKAIAGGIGRKAEGYARTCRGRWCVSCMGVSPSCTSNPAQTCPVQAPWRGAQPSHISYRDWRGAVTAADFWNTHGVDAFHGMNERVTRENQHFTGGWPGGTARGDVGWHHFYTGSWSHTTKHRIWYGGVFQDRGVQLQRLEESFGVASADANGGHNVVDVGYRTTAIDHGARLGIDVHSRPTPARHPRVHDHPETVDPRTQHRPAHAPRRLVRDYERHPHRSEAMIHLAVIDLMTRRLTGEAAPNRHAT